MAVGDISCWRCKRLIPPGGEGRCPAILESGRVCGKNHHTWHLGHDDHDRTVWRGPEHVCCNVIASTVASNNRRRGLPKGTKGTEVGRRQPQKRPPGWRSPDGRPWSQDWGGGHWGEE